MDRARMCDRLAQTGFAIAGGPRAANLSAALSDTMRTDSGDFLLGLDALGKKVPAPQSRRCGKYEVGLRTCCG